MCAMIFGLLAWYVRPTEQIDRIWSDLFLANQCRSATCDVVLVKVTARDLLMNGVDRLSRSYLAQTLRKLDAAGVARVLVDYNLGSDMLPQEEQLLADAAKCLGPDRLAVAYEPDPDLRPSASLLARMSQVDLRLIPDTDGRYRQLRCPADTRFGDSALWLATGENRPTQSPFDLRIDPRTIPSVALWQLHRDDFSWWTLRGARVILTLDRSAAKSRANLPIHGAVERGVLLAMATQARLNGYAPVTWRGDMMVGLTCAASLLIGLVIGMRSPTLRRASIQWFILALSVLSVALWDVLVLGHHSRPATALLVSIVGMNSALAFRLGLADLLLGMFAGNLSPEEVWLWRTKAEWSGPVVLFNAMGGIKRANGPAAELLGVDASGADNCREAIADLARLCMPELGQRSRQIAWTMDTSRIWQIEWPHANLPFAVFTDITENVERHEALQKRLITDPLTGIFNRAGFESRLARLDRGSNQGYAILFLDMNGFKEVNDTHGHEAGDILLKEAASRFSTVVRKADVLARLGGDEFAILLEGNLTPELLRTLRTKLEASLATPIHIGSTQVRVGVAVGFALATSPDERTEAVLRRADAAMYARKAEIKGKTRAADSSLAV